MRTLLTNRRIVDLGARVCCEAYRQTLAGDKGARLVRYSQRANRVGIRFMWASVGAFIWRLKLGAFCRVLRLTPENYKDALVEWFGRNWIYVMRPVIESIKPA